MKNESRSTEELEKELNAIQKVLTARYKDVELDKHKRLNINGITCKNISVNIWSTNGDSLYYSFYIIHDEKQYDIYYDGVIDYDKRTKENNWGYHPWWPIDLEEEYDEYSANGAFQFIPNGFSEAMENAYNFNGTETQAIKRLKSVGITNITHDSNEDL